MKKEVNKKDDKLVKIKESELLALVASKLKGRDLFPKKTENARNYLKGAKFSIPR
jgi:hypothetical protein